MWELFGQFLANETFATEMHINLTPLDEAAIPYVASDPGLRDGFQKPVRALGCKPKGLPPGYRAQAFCSRPATPIPKMASRSR